MQTYIEAVREAVKNKIDKRFANSSVQHAEVLIKAVIDDAKESIYILTTNFYAGFFNAIKKTLIQFLEKDKSKIYIITKENNNNMKEIEDLLKEYKNNLQVKFIKDNEFPKNNETKENVNYIVNDNNSYRLEYSDKYLNQGIVEAIANFNNKSESNTLIAHFKKLPTVPFEK